MLEREVTLIGNWAIERSLYEWTLRPKDGSVPMQDQANWIGIWCRDGMGAWRRGLRHVEQHAFRAGGLSRVS